MLLYFDKKEDFCCYGGNNLIYRWGWLGVSC